MNKLETVQFKTSFFVNQKIKFHNNLAVLLGKHYAGKTTVLNTLSEGFAGKKADFLVNNQRVSSSDFQVIYLRDDLDFEKEIRITKTSPFRHNIFKAINSYLLSQEKYQEITNKIQDLALFIESVVTGLFAKKLKALTNDDVVLKFDVRKINLENIVDNLLNVDIFDLKKQENMDENSFNQFLKRMLIFNVLKMATDENDFKRPIVVLIDNPELYTDLKTAKQLNAILKQLMDKNCYLVLSSNSVEYLVDFAQVQSLNWLNGSEVLHFDSPNTFLKKGIAVYQFLLNDKYSDWFSYFDNFDHIFLEEDLDREWSYFFANVFSFFLQGLFLDQVVLSETSSLEQKQLLTEFQLEKLVGKFFLPIRTVCLLVVFFIHWKIDYKLEPNLLIKRPKITTVFGKRN